MSNRADSSFTDTPRETPKGETPSESDRRLFELLDQYVDHLHQDDLASRSVLLERHPELMELLHCLESLDSLAVPPAPVRDADDKTPFVPDDGVETDTARTVLWKGGLGEPPDEDSLHEADSGIALGGGTAFGKYTLLEELGRGGMGVVYRAWQADLRRHVAIKMILQSRLASDDDVRRFYVEAQSAGGLMHAGIVRIHEVGQVGGQHYFTMEYIDGENLATRLRNTSYEPDEAAKCVAEVARAVHYLHEHGVVHRDLKPSNILLDSEGRPHVTDFGLAKIYDGSGDSGQTQSGTIVGTPSYMSPEQAAGRASKISPLCDVYSLGAILYELLCGRPPFQRDTPLDTLVDVIESEPSLLCKENPCIPRDLELICLKCLEKDPQRRYASAEKLADDLERFLRREDIEARPAGFVSKVKRWARREPALVSRLAGIAAAAGIVQVRYFFRNDVTPWEHYQFMVLFGVCAVMAFVFQRLLHHDSLADPARYGWAASDVIILTSVLYLAELPIGPVLIGYPLIIASAGLFFIVRLVLFTTMLSLLSFAVLIWARSPSIFDEAARGERSHYLLIFAVVLAVQGLITAYQVYRVRALSQFYEQRRI